MHIKRTKVIELAELGHSRSARDTALSEAHDAVVGAVLDAAGDDIDITFDETDTHLSVSASLSTLNRQESAALGDLLRAHAKGYAAATLMGLLGDLARVFRT